MIEDRHLTLELLRAIHRNEREPGDLIPVTMAHLFELCPHCREAFEAWREELGEGVAGPARAEYDPVFERLQARLRSSEPGEDDVPAGRGSGQEGTEGRSREDQGEAARERIAELLALPPRERGERLREAPGRYGAPVLAELLLEEAKGHLPGQPREAYALAGLARAVLQHGTATRHKAQLYSRALAHQANAVRAQGELRRADEMFEVARFLLNSQGGGDRLSRAELDSFEGSLRRAQRRFGEAQTLLSRAVMVFALEKRKLEAGRTLLKLGMTFREMGDLEAAIEKTTDACELFQERDEPALELFARHNLASMLKQAGQVDAARRLLDESASLYERYADPLTQLRRLWIEADLSRLEGDRDTAERAYRAVRDGFLGQGIGYDAALAALDLGHLYAEQGRTAELKRLAEDLVPVFESQDVHREAATALMLFQDAVRTEQVTLRYLAELSRYLERARLDPTLAFRNPD